MSKTHLSPEAVISIALGVPTLIIGVIGLWMTVARKSCASTIPDEELAASPGASSDISRPVSPANHPELNLRSRHDADGPQSTAALPEQAVTSSDSLSNASTLVEIPLDREEHVYEASLDVGVLDDPTETSHSDHRAQIAKPQHKSS